MYKIFFIEIRFMTFFAGNRAIGEEKNIVCAECMTEILRRLKIGIIKTGITQTLLQQVRLNADTIWMVFIKERNCLLIFYYSSTMGYKIVTTLHGADCFLSILCNAFCVYYFTLFIKAISKIHYTLTTFPLIYLFI